MARDRDGAAEVLVQVERMQVQESAGFLFEWRSEERPMTPQPRDSVAAALAKAAVRMHCWSKGLASGSGVDSNSEDGGEWTQLVVRLQPQLAPFVELSDGLGENLGHW